MLTIIKTFIIEKLAEFAGKSLLTLVIGGIVSFGLTNTLHKFTQPFKIRRAEKRGYDRGFEAASEQCVEKGGQMRRRRLLPFLRTEEPEPAWVKPTEFR